jgi:hypothetical protein
MAMTGLSSLPANRRFTLFIVVSHPIGLKRDEILFSLNSALRDYAAAAASAGAPP